MIIVSFQLQVSVAYGSKKHLKPLVSQVISELINNNPKILLFY